MEVVIDLICRGETRSEDEKKEVFATLESTGRDEFVAAGNAGYKEALKFVIWASDYDSQEELKYNGKRMTIYRTYGPRKDDKMELYAAMRAGNRG